MNNKYKLLLLAALVITISWATVHFLTMTSVQLKILLKNFTPFRSHLKQKLLIKILIMVFIMEGALGKWRTTNRGCV